uniref:hypothetical protein n=1 Tax=Nosocomiicoccus ampullae TaxID=489910 RepID=UPI00083520EF|nr:hypothetical protein [Nosocomiicoccus ampullae]
MKKRTIVLLIIAIIILFIPVVDKTSKSERVIIDNSTREIIHPDCFDEKKHSNWIDEVTFNNALNNKEYLVRDTCSIEKLPIGKTSIFNRMFLKKD